MNRKELIEAAAYDCGMKKNEVERVLDSLENIIIDELRDGGRVTIIGFGTFDTVSHEERAGRNPKSGEAVKIAASKSPRFKAGKVLKDAVGG